MAYDRNAPWQITRFAQRTLGLPQTGRWDEETQRAYEGGSPSARAQIDQLMTREGLSAYSVQRVTAQVSEPQMVDRSSVARSKVAGAISNAVAKPQSTTPQVKKAGQAVKLSGSSEVAFISQPDAIALARKYNSLAGLPAGTMEFMLNFEAQKVTGGYDAAKRGGSRNRYLGLYQFFDGGASWSDGQRWARTFGVHVPAMFPSGYSNAEANTAAAAGYAKMNASLLKKRGIPVTKETLYAAHQQGAGGFSNTVQSGKFAYAGVQSGPSVQALKTAFDQASA